jgi:hypothetical protein
MRCVALFTAINGFGWAIEKLDGQINGKQKKDMNVT